MAIDELDSTDVHLPFVGEHNVVNALASTAIAIALGVPLDKIKSGLQHATPPKGRLTRLSFGEHILIDDTYNANSGSIHMAGKVLANQSGQRILVLGDIGELGDEAVSEHAKLGQTLAMLDIDYILTVGTLMKHCTESLNNIRGNSEHFANKADLLEKLKTLLNEPSVILFKGSRSATMETLIHDLTQPVSE